jgi:hypothetical protein
LHARTYAFGAPGAQKAHTIDVRPYPSSRRPPRRCRPPARCATPRSAIRISRCSNCTRYSRRTTPTRQRPRTP